MAKKDDDEHRDDEQRVQAAQFAGLIQPCDQLRHLLWRIEWPSSITGQPKPDDSHVADHVRQLISGTWGEDLQQDEEDRTVGKVRYSTITRRVTVFRIAQEDEFF